MPQELLNIIWAALGTIITGLAGYAVILFKNWISSKIKDKKLAELLNKVTDIVADAVKEVYQTFVQSLKEAGKFTKEAQAEAKEKAIAIIKTRLTPELKQFVEENFGDIEVWIANQIEVALYNLKN